MIGFLLSSIAVIGQDQNVADSLKKIYEADTVRGENLLELLRNLSFHESQDLQLGLEYADELIALSTKENNLLYLYRGYMRKGSIYYQMGDSQEALQEFLKSIDAANQADYPEGEGGAYITIADTYGAIGNFENAELYYQKAIDILSETQDSITLAIAKLNFGELYFNNEKYDQALQINKESGELFEALDYTIGKAYYLGNTGMVYARLEQYNLAEKYIGEAITILDEMGDIYGVSTYLQFMSDIYIDKKDEINALKYAQQSLEMAMRNQLKLQIRDAHLQLSDIYRQIGDYQTSLVHYEDYIVYRDSITNLEEVQKLADLRTDFEVSKKQVEVDLLNVQKENQQIITLATAIALILIGIIAIGLYKRFKYTQKTNKIIQDEKERSDNLLLNILPEETAIELKARGKVEAKKYDSVSILFTDFKGFTTYAENLAPEELVSCVDFYFSKFDEIIEKHGIEKIKTVGDAYMCASGLPEPSKDHANQMVGAAIEIANFVNGLKESKDINFPPFDIRIGINTGPVVAGVVGTKKFAYDIWGDAVNIASRMESNSLPGRINISENTYQLIKNDYNCEYRGELLAKNRGQLKMYFVQTKKHKLAS
jgi:class 3 adenylate cyclase/predicted negative regulator of RcsB-dependent stress response